MSKMNNVFQKFSRLIEVKASDSGDVPSQIQVLLPGQWDTLNHGSFVINDADLDSMVQNFQNNVRKEGGLPIDIEHDTDGGAVGWIMDLEHRIGEGLWATVDWTKQGLQLLQDRTFKFFSPEFATYYCDPEDGTEYTNVLIGGAITNRPLFKNLQPIVASEGAKGKPGNIMYFDENNKEESNMPTLDEIRQKDASALTDEEKQFLSDHAADLTDEERAKYGVAAPEKTEESTEEETKTEDEGKTEDSEETTEEGEQPADGSEVVAGSEDKKTVVITASQLKALETQAQQGAEALLRLNRIQATDKVKAWAFNDKGTGKFPSKMVDTVTDFYMTLDTKQKQAFEGIINSLPSASKMFGEIGEQVEKANGQESALARITLLANEKMQKDGITYDKAVVEVMKENAELAGQYNEELEENQAALQKKYNV